MTTAAAVNTLHTTGHSAWQRNLHALFATQPRLAERMSGVQIPSDTIRTTGRDGSDTFRMADKSRENRWLGQSSMPSISAPAILADFSGCTHNIAIPGVLTGFEPLVALDKLPSFCAVFVVEDDPVLLRLVMEIYDYADSIRSGRLVFLVGPDIGPDVVQLFEREPGYLMPTTLLTVPQRTAAEIANTQARLEQAAQIVGTSQSEAIQRAVTALQQTEPPPTSAQPRPAIISSDTSAATIRFARRLERAVEALGWRTQFCVPDRPARCHLAARLAAIVEAQADTVLVINGPFEPLRSLLPKHIRLVCVQTDSMANTDRRDNIADGDLLVLPAQSSAESFHISANGARSILLGAIAADPKNGRQAHPSLPGLPRRIVVFGDLPDARAESLDITLQSHVALWTALGSRIRQDIDRFAVHGAGHGQALPSALAAAEKQSGTILTDSQLRDQFLTLAQSCLVPSILAGGFAEALSDAGCRVVTVGTNWNSFDAETIHHDSLSDDELIAESVPECVAVLLFDSHPLSVQRALDASLEGLVVMIHGSLDAFACEYPYLADMARHWLFFQTRQELLRLARITIKPDPDLLARVDHARQLVLSRHTLAHRLREWTTRTPATA